MRRELTLALLMAAPSGCGGGLPSGYSPQEGDVVFQSLPQSPLVDAIEGATKSSFSHCGIVVRDGDDFKVLEAFRTVHETPLVNFINRARDGRLTVFRFKAPWSSRLAEVVAKAKGFEGRPYDSHYAFDDDAIYCSELIFKAFKAATGETLGTVQRLGDLNWPPFEDFIRQEEGGSVPVDREMITPKELSQASQLEIAFGDAH